VIIGMTMAALITSQLSRPVRSLAAAMRDVQQGNLNIHLPVGSTDEVGRLTDSFNFFVKELRSKEQMKQTFGKYIDPRILERVLAQPGAETVAGGPARYDRAVRRLGRLHELVGTAEPIAHGDIAQPTL